MLHRRAPLHAISNLTGWIEEDMEGKFSEETSDNFNIIKNRVARMEDLINGLLAYARANSAKSEKSIVDLNLEVADIAKSAAIEEAAAEGRVHGPDVDGSLLLLLRRLVQMMRMLPGGSEALGEVIRRLEAEGHHAAAALIS